MLRKSNLFTELGQVHQLLLVASYASTWIRTLRYSNRHSRCGKRIVCRLGLTGFYGQQLLEMTSTSIE
jgi:hypothetical protein